MIDNNKWTNTLPDTNKKIEKGNYNTDPNKWLNTIPKKNGNNLVKKFSLMFSLFIIGIMLVSTIKNKTRILQKEINDLQASINSLKIDLHKSTLDYEVLTSPENISFLAKKYLEEELTYYKKSQIKKLGEKETQIVNKDEIKKNNDLKNSIKLKVAKKIDKKKKELSKLKELSKQPKKIPQHVKGQVAQKIEEKKIELKNLYDNPKEVISLKKVQQWGSIQIVKAILGIPIFPGR
tara:strand:- start:1123 stop:1827 length:705 start_codon:yes stop_codon:yes gene_type:complete